MTNMMLKAKQTAEKEVKFEYSGTLLDKDCDFLKGSHGQDIRSIYKQLKDLDIPGSRQI